MYAPFLYTIIIVGHICPLFLHNHWEKIIIFWKNFLHSAKHKLYDLGKQIDEILL